MNKFETKIAECGLTENDLSAKLKGLIKQHREGIEQYDTQTAELKDMDSDTPEYDELEQATDDLEETLLANDDELVKMIATYARNKPVYDANAKRMLEGRMAKAANKAQKTDNTATATVPPPPQPQNVTANPQPQPVVAASGAAVATATKGEDDKDGGIGDWLFWGILGVAGLLVGVNLYKNR